MSKLDELIKELCPNGVEYVTLEKCCEILDSKRKPVTKAARQSGKYPYYGANGIQDYVSDHIFDGTYILIGEDGSVLTKNGTPVVTWATGKIWVNNHAHIVKEIDGVILRYLFHYIQTVNISNLIHGNIPKLTGKDFKAIPIPLPPLPVQEEIVRILDNFTEQLAEQLAELTARKKQYEYYRDSLLTFGDEVEWKKLGSICDVTKLAGYEFTEHVTYAEEGSIIALRGLNVKKGYIDLSQVKYIDNSNFSKLTRSKLYINDMLFTYVGTIGEVALVDKNDSYYLAPNVARIRILNDKLNPKFMRYYFQTSHFFDKQINRYLASSSMKNLTMQNIRKFEIPLPPLAEQQRIVDILDRFDTLCNDISNGLPAEIKMRQQQYEYYRDKLLTFKNIKES